MNIREASQHDIDTLIRFLRLLAEFDGHPESFVATHDDLVRHMFGPTPRCHALIAEADGHPVAFATYHFTFSTFAAKPGLWLDDLFVLDDYRGAGVGSAILRRLMSIAVDEGCCRVNWIVNQSNERGIAFYQRIGADVLGDYRLCVMDENAMARYLEP